MPASPSLKAHPLLDQWLAIGEDGRVIVRSGKVDIGQRISTALALIAAEELDVAYARVDVARAETGIAPDEGVTAGSNSMEESGNAVRAAAATARRHLLALAAEALEAEAGALTVEDGLIRAPGANRTVSYAELIGGRAFGIDVDPAAPVKPAAAHGQIGTRVAMRNIEPIVTGAAYFVHDMTLPGMLHARPVRPPHYTAKLAGLDEAVLARLAADGVRVVRDGSFLAVAHEDEYAAVKGAERLYNAARWDTGAGLAEGDIFEALTANERVSLPVRDGAPVKEPVPPLADPPAGAAVTLSARFERPYHMHGSIGPSAAMARMDGDGTMTVWSHSQGIYMQRASVAESLGLETEALRVIHTPGAGCYGHNGADDAALDAALVARAIPGRPVLLKWTREDEHAWEPYGSAMAMEMRASLDADGTVIDWSHESFSDTYGMRPRPGPNRIGPARMLAMRHVEDALEPPLAQPAMGKHAGIHRNLDPGYDFASRRLVKNLVRGLPLRTSTLRALGAYANVFAIESFMDELAEAGGIDPVEFRIRHLADPRARAVVRACAEALHRPGAVPDGRGRGIAYARYKNAKTYAAVGFEVSVGDAAEVVLHRAVAAADAGEVVDAEGLSAQLEGGIVQAASWTLHEQVTWDRDGITSRDWETYPILRFDNVPEIECVLIDRPGEPYLGAGEATAGPTAGAIANAVHAATGLRLRRLPFTPDAIRKAALE
jgi:CO/xanthine dehydrogenase Mo-binding subunit